MQRLLLFLVINLQFILTSTSYAEVCSEHVSAFSRISNLKDQAVDLATENFPQFCQWNRMDRFVKQFSDSTRMQYQKFKDKNDPESAANLIVNESSKNVFDIWILSMAGHPKIKALASQYSFIVNCPEKTGIMCIPASHSELELALSKKIKNPTLKIPLYQPLKDTFSSSGLQRTGACVAFGKGKLSDCLESLKQIEQFMKIETYQIDQVAIMPFDQGEQSIFVQKGAGFAFAPPMDSAMVTAAPVIKTVLTDKNATEGLRLAALKMLHLQDSKIQTNANIFTDINNSFQQAGLSEEDAIQKTWDVMGALAATGPNFAKRWSRHSAIFAGQKMNLKNIEDNPNAFYLQAIAEAIPNLDSLKSIQHSGSLYSLPDGIEFPCDIGKSYHFWMTAYLSRKLTLQGTNPEVASSSAYIANLGYQVQRESFNGTQLKMKNLGYFDSTENGIRLDLHLAAAGAKFGATPPTDNSPINLAEKFRTNLKNTSIVKTELTLIGDIAPGLAGKTAHFMERIQPNLIYDSFK